MDEQLKNRFHEQCLFMNTAGEIMSVEYGKSGFRRSDLSTENRKANREIVNSYNEWHGITAEQVKMMRNGALLGWDTLHDPYPSHREESSLKDGSIFEIEVSRPGAFGTGTATEVSLPATPYELVDALDKARVTDERVIYSVEILHSELDYLPQLISPSANLYELNHLAQRLSALNEWEMNCFEGMVTMDTIQKQYAPIAIERLINMTHSTSDCQIVYEAHNDVSLGMFYTDNGFVKELETLPERIFPWLDYEKIGKEMREGEGGVFTPSGYVVQNGEIEQRYKSGDAIPTQMPDYAVHLKVTKGYFNDPEYDNDLASFLKLPNGDEELLRAVGEVAAASPTECTFSGMDCIVPRLTEKISDELEATEGDCYCLVGELARHLQKLDGKDGIPIYKAMLEAAPEDISLEEALDLCCQTEDFSLMREMSSPSDYAAKEIQRMVPYENDEGLEKYLDLPGYGRFLMERSGILETPYGLLEPLDGKTVEQCLNRPPAQGMKLE